MDCDAAATKPSNFPWENYGVKMACRVVPTGAMGPGLYISVSINHYIWAAPKKEGMTLAVVLFKQGPSPK